MSTTIAVALGNQMGPHHGVTVTTAREDHSER
jgi:hypothetical protein